MQFLCSAFLLLRFSVLRFVVATVVVVLDMVVGFGQCICLLPVRACELWASNL